MRKLWAEPLHVRLLLQPPWRYAGGRGQLLPSGFCRYHNAEGTPVINAGKFPDMLNMTSWAHALGLTAGWYG